MYLYRYSGPVMNFNLIITNNWKAYTYAVSEAKAKSNMAFQFKKAHGLAPNAKIILPGKILLEEIPENIGKDGHQISINEYLKSIGKTPIAI